ncbi:MAG: xanthine dehydrogenase family protein subunit M [Elusimicrobia bacterium]|nr:xanthine dehydrogenase family protein subunit M [Elusimicrobiota bacterium]
MTLLRPATAAEALSLYAKTPGALPLAGGTDFMVSWNMGLLNGRTVLDLSRLVEWSRIRVSTEAARLGALVTHSQIQEHPILAKQFPLLVGACATIGAAQIQNRGTIGGNLANASPAGDTFPALAVYEAVVLAASAGGRRRLPLSELFAGVKKTTLAAGELIEAVELPYPGKPARQFFRKIGTRAAQAISKTVGAGLLWTRAGKIADCRIAFGSVAPTVRRLKAVEEFVKGKRLGADLAREAAARVERDISPIDDLRSTRAYRLAVSANLVREFLS